MRQRTTVKNQVVSFILALAMVTSNISPYATTAYAYDEDVEHYDEPSSEKNEDANTSSQASDVQASSQGQNTGTAENNSADVQQAAPQTQTAESSQDSKDVAELPGNEFDLQQSSLVVYDDEADPSIQYVEYGGKKYRNTKFTSYVLTGSTASNTAIVKSSKQLDIVLHDLAMDTGTAMTFCGGGSFNVTISGDVILNGNTAGMYFADGSPVNIFFNDNSTLYAAGNIGSTNESSPVSINGGFIKASEIFTGDNIAINGGNVLASVTRAVAGDGSAVYPVYLEGVPGGHSYIPAIKWNGIDYTYNWFYVPQNERTCIYLPEGDVEITVGDLVYKGSNTADGTSLQPYNESDMGEKEESPENQAAEEELARSPEVDDTAPETDAEEKKTEESPEEAESFEEDENIPMEESSLEETPKEEADSATDNTDNNEEIQPAEDDNIEAAPAENIEETQAEEEENTEIQYLFMQDENMDVTVVKEDGGSFRESDVLNISSGAVEDGSDAYTAVLGILNEEARPDNHEYEIGSIIALSAGIASEDAKADEGNVFVYSIKARDMFEDIKNGYEARIFRYENGVPSYVNNERIALTATENEITMTSTENGADYIIVSALRRNIQEKESVRPEDSSDDEENHAEGTSNTEQVETEAETEAEAKPALDETEAETEAETEILSEETETETETAKYGNGKIEVSADSLTASAESASFVGDMKIALTAMNEGGNKASSMSSNIKVDFPEGTIIPSLAVKDNKVVSDEGDVYFETDPGAEETVEIKTVNTKDNSVTLSVESTANNEEYRQEDGENDSASSIVLHGDAVKVELKDPEYIVEKDKIEDLDPAEKDIKDHDIDSDGNYVFENFEDMPKVDEYTIKTDVDMKDDASIGISASSVITIDGIEEIEIDEMEAIVPVLTICAASEGSSLYMSTSIGTDIGTINLAGKQLIGISGNWSGVYYWKNSSGAIGQYIANTSTAYATFTLADAATYMGQSYNVEFGLAKATSNDPAVFTAQYSGEMSGVFVPETANSWSIIKCLPKEDLYPSPTDCANGTNKSFTTKDANGQALWYINVIGAPPTARWHFYFTDMDKDETWGINGGHGPEVYTTAESITVGSVIPGYLTVTGTEDSSGAPAIADPGRCQAHIVATGNVIYGYYGTVKHNYGGSILSDNRTLYYGWTNNANQIASTYGVTLPVPNSLGVAATPISTGGQFTVSGEVVSVPGLTTSGWYTGPNKEGVVSSPYPPNDLVRSDMAIYADAEIDYGSVTPRKSVDMKGWSLSELPASNRKFDFKVNQTADHSWIRDFHSVHIRYKECERL